MPFDTEYIELLLDYIEDDENELIYMFNSHITDRTLDSLVKCYVNDEAMNN